MSLRSGLGITALAVSTYGGRLYAQVAPAVTLPAELRSACDTIAVVLHALHAATVKQSTGSVEQPNTHARLPWCRLEAWGDVRALPAEARPEDAVVRRLGWPRDPAQATRGPFGTADAVVRGTVFCDVVMWWNGERSAAAGPARHQPPYGYYLTARCRVEAAPGLALGLPAVGNTANAAVVRGDSIVVTRGPLSVVARPLLPTDTSRPPPAAPRPPGAAARTPADSNPRVRAPSPPVALSTGERVIGPLTWKGKQVSCVLTKVWDGRDTTVSALRLIDARQTALYQGDYHVAAGPTGLEEWLYVTPELLEGQGDTALMLDEVSEPSAPLGGSSREILVWQDGRVRPLSPALTIYGEFLELSKGSAPNTRRLLPGNLMPVRVWAYSFAVLVSLEIRLPAFASGDTEPVRPQVQIDSPSGLAVLPITDVVRGRLTATQRVMLYRSASGSAGEPIQVGPTSTVQYGPAYGRVHLDRDPEARSMSIEADVVRLEVTIDGKTGFVDPDDFEAIGLSFAG